MVTCLTRGSRRRAKPVGLLEQGQLGGKFHGVDRAVAAVERPVGARRIGHGDAAVACAHRLDGVGGALQRGLADIARMGIGRGLAGDGAQAEALAGIEARRPEPAVVEHQPLRLAELQKKLAVVGTGQRFVEQASARCRSSAPLRKNRSPVS
jgi:hypothetical protein